MLIGYARVSTAEKNPAHQIDALVRAGVAPDDVYVDHASGAKASRPQLDLVLQLLRAGDTLVWHHSRAHRLFANARWSGDALGLVLADLIVARLLPADSALTIAVDDTLFKRSGKKVFGVACHHDGAAKGPKPIGFGNCWVVAGIVVELPFLSRPVCLPVLARLWRPRHTGKIAHARELAELIAAR